MILSVEVEPGQRQNINAEIDPGKYSSDMHDNLTAPQMGEGGKATVSAFLALVTSWDVTDDSGQPVPITAEVLSKEPFGFWTLDGWIGEIIKEIRPNK